MRQVAERLNVARDTVYRLIARGTLPALRVAGAMLRVREADVLKLLD